MRKKIWKILPLVTGLVLLTASSTLTVHGESDNTIDVTLFKLNLPDDWSYDPNDISDYEYTCSVNVFEGRMKTVKKPRKKPRKFHSLKRHPYCAQHFA